MSEIPETAGDLPPDTMVWRLNKSRTAHIRNDCIPIKQAKERGGKQVRYVPAGSLYNDDEICRDCLHMLGLIPEYRYSPSSRVTCRSCHAQKPKNGECPFCELAEAKGVD